MDIHQSRFEVCMNPKSACCKGLAVCENYGWLQVKCHRCETEASIPLEHVRRPRDTPIWKLEAALKCRSCKKGRYAPPVHMIKLTETRQTNPYRWVHPDDDDRR
jgi:hypothetical protein